MIQFSKRSVPHSIVSMWESDVRVGQSCPHGCLYDSANFATLRCDPPWSGIYLYGPQKAGLVGSDELAAMSDLFKAKCGKFEADIRKTLSSEREMQVIRFCKKGSPVAQVFLWLNTVKQQETQGSSATV